MLKRFIKILVITLLLIVLAWTGLTIWVEWKGPERKFEIGDPKSLEKVLIVYDADPIYNLDERVCRSFGKALADGGMYVQVVTVPFAQKIGTSDYDVYVFCANTYNWRPDWALTGYLKGDVVIASKKVITITLGSGSTTASQRKLEALVKSKNGILIDSRSFWLMRPNDESKLQEKNVDVAAAMAYAWGHTCTDLLRF